MNFFFKFKINFSLSFFLFLKQLFIIKTIYLAFFFTKKKKKKKKKKKMESNDFNL